MEATKTYAEVGGEKPFDWNAFLNKDSWSYDELSEAEDLANNWVTCACGNLCDVIERNFIGEPKDRELSHLGALFSRRIDDLYRAHSFGDKDILLHRQNQAKEILSHIEARSAQLIQEINSKTKG